MTAMNRILWRPLVSTQNLYNSIALSGMLAKPTKSAAAKKQKPAVKRVKGKKDGEKDRSKSPEVEEVEGQKEGAQETESLEEQLGT